MRVKFTASITFRDIQLGQVTCSCDLNKIRCLDEMGAFNGPIRDQAGAITISETPGYFVLLCVTNCRTFTRFWGSPQTEVVYGVDVGVLAHGRLISRRSTFISTLLTVLTVVRSVGWQVRCTIRLRINIGGDQRYRYEYTEKGHRIYPSPGGDI